ncbi:MAG: RluA family pseudouridine synthase [Chloroflexi bacterium]|nr:RluA family pseudouridine synthase [Chloroflexota bacterium]
MDRQEKYKYEGPGKIRLDVFLAGFSELTRSRISRLICCGHVTVDGETVDRPAHFLKGGEEVKVTVPAPEPAVPEPEDIPLDILYEDSDLVIINKQRGMSVHPGAGRVRGTLVSALLHRCTDLSGIGGVVRPGIVHRLDKDTSGVLIVAKNDRTHLALSRQFSGREVKKHYLALVKGKPKHKEIRVDAPLGRSPSDRKKFVVRQDGRKAITNVSLREPFGDYSLLAINPETGRTHQIRVHLAWLKLPIVGDPVYGSGKNPWSLSGQFLHAERIVFRHPADNRVMDFTAPLPGELEKILEELRSKSGVEKT